MDFSDFGDLMKGMENLDDMMKGMQNAYTDGLSAISGMGEMMAEEIEPTHKIEIDIRLKGHPEGHAYEVDAHLVFGIDLGSVLENPMGDIGAVLDSMGMDLGDEAGAVIEQLAQPRLVGTLLSSKVREFILSDENGRIDSGINESATCLATLQEEKLLLNFEGVFSYPQHPGAFYILPTTDKMQENVVFEMNALDSQIVFEWTDQDNLEVKGKAHISVV